MKGFWAGISIALGVLSVVVSMSFGAAYFWYEMDCLDATRTMMAVDACKIQGCTVTVIDMERILSQARIFKACQI